MTLKLFDTYSREIREFQPIEHGKAGLYCCGPTVYNYAHIGNLRTYVFEDFLRRVLELNGFDVKHVLNITDVGHLVSDADEGEDKMTTAAIRTGKTAWELADIYTEAFMGDLASLNVVSPTIVCKATDHIAEQIEAIQQIEAKGMVYSTEDGVYFDTSQDPEYGYLARLDKEGLRVGSRVDQGEKRNITDFALWKFSPTDETRQMEWDSPWGKGFPGWHIECSAMAAKYLGPLFDIHCGGKDHIPIHHSNEIAQARACYGTKLSNYWLHGYFLQTDSKKMSKSTGEFLRIESLVERNYDPLAYRFLCLLAHYRKDTKFNWEILDSAATALKRLRDAFYRWPTGGSIDEQYRERFVNFVNDDLNIPQAVALVWEMVKTTDLSEADKKATLIYFDTVLGLELVDWVPAQQQEIPEIVLNYAHQRQQARAAKDWSAADIARKELSELGYSIKDTEDGFVLTKHG